MNNKPSRILTLLVFVLTLLFFLPNYASAADTDGDGIDNPIDNCPTTPNGPFLGTCTAGDLGNTCENDEQCGTGGLCSNSQEDSSMDGFGDVCDFCSGDGQYDFDKDGLCDDEDNCYSVPNPGQENSDGDDFGDVCTNNIPMFSSATSYAGSYQEIGRQVAHLHPDNIFYLADIFMRLGVTPQSAQDYYDAIEDIIPDSIKAHMQGMAFGLTEVRPFSYQTAWDITLVSSFAIDILNIPSGGCTAFVVASEAGTFLAHNTDGYPTTEHTNMVNHYKPDNGDNSYIHFFTPGFVDVGLGLNDKGIGITFNLGRPNVNATMGLPVLFMVRYVMEKATTLAEVVSYFQNFIDSGNNFGYAGAIFLVVDFKDSSMAKIQVRSEKIKVTYGEELKPGVTYVAITNHFLGDFNEDPEYYYESSWMRLERLLEILPQYETYDLATCWEILSDTDGGEPNNNTICRRGSSLTTITNIFTKNKAYYTLGLPCEYLDTYPVPITRNFCYDPSGPDGDGDGVEDCSDNCPGVANSDQTDTDADCIGNVCDPYPDNYDPSQPDSDSDGVGDNCDNCLTDSNPAQEDADSDGLGDACDNCPDDYNPDQEDNYPTWRNGCGDACECEGDFEPDGDVDGTDAYNFKLDFGRRDCDAGTPCNGDFICDGDVDGSDGFMFIDDFGRRDCPACEFSCY